VELNRRDEVDLHDGVVNPSHDEMDMTGTRGMMDMMDMMDTMCSNSLDTSSWNNSPVEFG